MTSSASSKIWSGTVSRTVMPTMPPTTSFRLSRCCTLIVVQTSMPASSNSCTSCQRLGWREPGALLCASSSSSSTRGRRASAASRSNSRSVRPWCGSSRSGSCSRPCSCCAVSLRPWVSTSPTRTSRPPGVRAGRRPAWRRSCPRLHSIRSRCAACPAPPAPAHGAGARPGRRDRGAADRAAPARQRTKWAWFSA